MDGSGGQLHLEVAIDVPEKFSDGWMILRWLTASCCPEEVRLWMDNFRMVSCVLLSWPGEVRQWMDNSQVVSCVLQLMSWRSLVRVGLE